MPNFILNLRENVSVGLNSAADAAVGYTQAAVPAVEAQRELSKSGQELLVVMRQVFEEQRSLTVGTQQQTASSQEMIRTNTETIVVYNQISQSVLMTVESIVSLIDHTRQLWKASGEMRDELVQTTKRVEDNTLAKVALTKVSLQLVKIIPRVGGALSGWGTVAFATYGITKLLAKGLDNTGIEFDSLGKRTTNYSRAMDMAASKVNSATYGMTRSHRAYASAISQTYEDTIQPTLRKIGQSIDKEVTFYSREATRQSGELADSFIAAGEAALWLASVTGGGKESLDEYRKNNQEDFDTDQRQAQVDAKQAGAQTGFAQRREENEKDLAARARKAELERLNAIKELDAVQGELDKVKSRFGQRIADGLRQYDPEMDSKGKDKPLTEEQQKANAEWAALKEEEKVLKDRADTLEKERATAAEERARQLKEERIELTRSQYKAQGELNIQYLRSQTEAEIEAAKASGATAEQVQSLRLRLIHEEHAEKRRIAFTDMERLEADAEREKSISQASHDYRMDLMAKEIEAATKRAEEQLAMEQSARGAEATQNATLMTAQDEARIRAAERMGELAARHAKDAKQAYEAEEDAARKVARIKEDAIKREGELQEKLAQTDLERLEARQQTAQRLLENKLQAEVAAEGRKLQLLDQQEEQARQAKEKRQQMAQQNLQNAGFDAAKLLAQQDPRRVTRQLQNRAGHFAGQEFDRLNKGKMGVNQAQKRQVQAQRRKAVENARRDAFRKEAKGQTDPRQKIAAQRDLVQGQIEDMRKRNELSEDELKVMEDGIRAQAESQQAIAAFEARLKRMEQNQGALNNNATAQRQRAQKGIQ